jgi:Flp pilus assembly pilin Flp
MAPSAIIHHWRPRERTASARRTMQMVDFLLSRYFAMTSDDKGQGLAEYALILALIAIIAIVALIFLGEQISSILSSIGAQI